MIIPISVVVWFALGAVVLRAIGVKPQDVEEGILFFIMAGLWPLPLVLLRGAK